MPVPACAPTCPLVGDLLAEIALLTGQSIDVVRVSHLPPDDVMHGCVVGGREWSSRLAAAECCDGRDHRC